LKSFVNQDFHKHLFDITLLNSKIFRGISHEISRKKDSPDSLPSFGNVKWVLCRN